MASNIVPGSESLAEPLPTILSADLRPNVEHLVTEDDQPVDNIFAEKQQRLLAESLHSSWDGGGHPFIALSNVGLFYAVARPPLVPDVLVSLDVTLPPSVMPKAHRSYFCWEYGKPPDIVVEVVSNREGGEATTKLELYARIGVSYYVIFDPEQHLDGGVLCGYERRSRHYVPLALPLQFPAIGLGMRLWEGRYEDLHGTWLRWVAADGEIIATGAERAQHAQQLASIERARAERLAAQLRNLGVDPEA